MRLEESRRILKQQYILRLTKMVKEVKMLEKYLFINEQIIEGNPDCYEDKPELVSLLEFKENRLQDWSMILKEIGNSNLYNVRDVSPFCNRHSLSALLTVKHDKFPGRGMLFSISFIDLCLGFCFFEYRDNSDEEASLVVSYQPTDLIFDLPAKTIQILAKTSFPNLKVFTAGNCEIEVSRIIIDFQLYTDLNLWKAYFSTNDNIFIL